MFDLGFVQRWGSSRSRTLKCAGMTDTDATVVWERFKATYPALQGFVEDRAQIAKDLNIQGTLSGRAGGAFPNKGAP